MEKKDSDNKIYYGQSKCQNGGKKICQKNSFFVCERLYLCGVHSKKLNKVQLPNMYPKDKQSKLEIDKESIEKFAK